MNSNVGHIKLKMMGLTFLDVIKGLLFAAFMVVLYYFILFLCMELLSPLIILAKINLIFIPVLFALLFVIVLIVSFSKAVQAGFSIHTMFGSIKKNKPKNNNKMLEE